MMRSLSLTCLGATLCAAATLESDPKSPVAWVYVSSSIGNTAVNEVYGFDAASNGKLTPIPGSPFAADVDSIALNGTYLFGTKRGGIYIDSYLIESTGALRFAAQTNFTQPNGGNGIASGLILDHTGATLYDLDNFSPDFTDVQYQAFRVDKPTGKLVYLNETRTTGNAVLSFIGNNKFAYSSVCAKFQTPIISGVQRNSNGSLTHLDHLNAPYPTAPIGGYCPNSAAADPTNHVAMSFLPCTGYHDCFLPFRLATYTVDSSGKLTTTSTYENMPKTQVGNVSDLNMSWSGKLLAVGGDAGLQVFHFNGAAPITPYTPLLTTSAVDQFFWDFEGHLYAISYSASKLWVFTVTPTSYSQAPGSPYTINSPNAIIVQPLPRYQFPDADDF